ncbi:MAG TPA: hypothetical protein VHK88_05800 [Aquihabitans sp.]|jgi:hypothetical protein|nr:hypothetical protein [Aquihabitans sp.]
MTHPMTGDDTAATPDAPAVTVAPLEPFPVCRSASLEGAGWELELARAQRSAIDASLGRLRGLAPGVEALLLTAWAAAPVPLPEALALADGVDLTALHDELLTEHHLPPDRVVLGRSRLATPGGVPLAFSEPQFAMTRPLLAPLAASMADGAAVTVLGVEEHAPRLNAVFADLDRLAGTTCRGDLTLLGREAVLVLDEAVGGALVVVEGGLDVVTEASAVGDQAPPGASRHVVAAGDGIVVPPGRSVRATAGADGALVLVVVVPRFPLADHAQEIVLQGTFWPLLRSVIPGDLSLGWSSYEGSLLEDGLQGALRQVASPGDLDMLLARARARLRSRHTAALHACPPSAIEAIPPDRGLRSTLPGGYVVHNGSTPDHAVLLGGGRRLVTTAAGARAIAVISDGGLHPLAELAAVAPHPDGEALVGAVARTLLSTGLAELGMLP